MVLKLAQLKKKNGSRYACIFVNDVVKQPETRGFISSDKWSPRAPHT